MASHSPLLTMNAGLFSPFLHVCLQGELILGRLTRDPDEGEAKRICGRSLPRRLSPGASSCAAPGQRCGWVESTGVRHGGWNVPGMLGAAYLGQECTVVLLAGSLLA